MFDLTNTIRDMKTKAGKITVKCFKQLSAKDAEENFNHAAKQAYIAFAQAITAAAFEEVDTTPLEGFDADALDEILGLRAKGLRRRYASWVTETVKTTGWLILLKKSKEDLVTLID
jgi:hypothetical protein